jgi:hypothetical protein
MTMPERRDGMCSSRCRSTGTDTLYGRFATRREGSPGSSVTRSASSCTTVSDVPGCMTLTVCGSCSASRRSISTAMTDAPASSNPSVSDPSPGPTSSTVSPGCTPAICTMRRTVLPSCTKFWPSFLVGVTSRSSARSRISAGPSRRGVLSPPSAACRCAFTPVPLARAHHATVRTRYGNSTRPDRTTRRVRRRAPRP